MADAETARVTAGGLMCNLRAASAKLPLSATLTNVCIASSFATPHSWPTLANGALR
nr:hypothetical protein [Novosphingobium sediminis]